MKSPASTRSPVLEATWSAAAWLIVGLVWYVLQYWVMTDLFANPEAALQMVPMLLGVMAAAFITRYLTTLRFRSSGAYYLVDLTVWIALACAVALLTGSGFIDPQGTLLYFALWMMFPGSLLVIIAVTTSIVLSACNEKIRRRRAWKREI